MQRTQLVKYRGPNNGWRSIWLKNETDQVSGAFKIRGVLNYFKTHQINTPVVTASTGNHGTAVSILAKSIGLQAYIFVPFCIAEKKKTALHKYGAKIIEIEGNYDDCEIKAREYAELNQYSFIHSFDEDSIIEGHRSIFFEIEQDQPDIPNFFIPTGGGGLLTAALRHHSTRNIVGVEYNEAAALYYSLKYKNRVCISFAGNPVEGLCVSKIGEKVFKECLRTQTQIQIVDIECLKNAVRLAWEYNEIKCELAGAASLAAALKAPIRGDECVCVISGGNIDEQLFSNIIQKRK